ncbi:hypothetical protein C8R43DRAFT_1121078 [Mycena crocata]|nr:hypothetical protein C8R43DRAFT_1121078 [Mycena crocata]
MSSFTPRIIAWVVVQVYFALSSEQEWNKKDGDFDYEDFFWTIYDLFDNKASFVADVSGPSALSQLKAKHLAKRTAAAAAASPSPASSSGASASLV